ncbi:MAG: TetR/AcrR family transcriptional regulator [Actinomycetota bacterium]
MVMVDSTESELRWVRRAESTRGGRTKAALLDAAEERFAELGVEGATVVDIAAAAGVTIGALYHHYRDKHALQVALFERYAAELDATTKAALDPARWEGASVADILSSYVAFSLRTDRDRPGRKRACLMVCRVDPALAARHDELRVQVDEGLRRLLLARRDELGHPDPELAVSFVLEQLGSILRSRLLEARLPTRFGTRTDEQLHAEAMRSVCSYLEIDPPSEPHPIQEHA